VRKAIIAFVLTAVIAACGDEPVGPVNPLPGPDLAADISSGASYACAIVRDASIRCTGALAAFAPSSGQWDVVEGGAEHACGIRREGSVGCWGVNIYNKLAAPFERDFIEVTAGTQHSCAVRSDGTIACWGLNDAGQTVPPTGAGYHAIAASTGGHHTCALDSAGAVVCWGLGNGGQTRGLPGDGFLFLTTTEDGGCAMDGSGRIRCWGTELPGLPADAGFSSFSAGRDFLCAIRNGRAQCWGTSDSDGQLDPPDYADFVRLAAGYAHACALRGNGHVICWGSIESFPGVAQ